MKSINAALILVAITTSAYAETLGSTKGSANYQTAVALAKTMSAAGLTLTPLPHRGTQIYLEKVDKKEIKFQPVKPEQVSDQVWNDLLAVRKTKRAVESQTAWTRINNSIDKARKATGHTLEDIYSYWFKRSWAGFEHQWYIDAHPQPTNNIQGATNANNQPVNSQPQQFDTSTTAGYAAKLDADADAYYAEQAAIAQQATDGSTENAF